jgi:hypothetical protein
VRPTRRAFLLAGGAGIVLVVLALVLVVVFAVGNAPRPRLVARSTAGGSATFAPSGVSTATLAIPVEDARAVVVRYLDDINTQNRTDAAGLICAGLVADWRSKIDKPGGDFTLAVTGAVFHGATPAAGGVSLSYELDVRPRASNEVNSSTVTFIVTGSAGAYRLCGES